jgi:membrane protein DedA with SNARE-associated domain
MKNFPLPDILFILTGGVACALLNHFGQAELLSKYAVVVILVAYFAGKLIGQAELRKKWKGE